MATITKVICDKCSSDSGVQTVDWEIATETGQIDLCRTCLRNALKAVQPSGKVASHPEPTSQQVIREWAKVNGHKVPAKGRIPTEVMQAYNARHSAPSLASLG